MNPLTQATLIIVATIVGLMQPGIYGPIYVGVFFVIALILTAVLGKVKRFLLITVTAILPAAVLMFALQFFFTSGDDVLVEWWIFTGTAEGLANAIRFVSRFLMIGVGVLLLTQVLDLRTFARDLEQRGVSPRATYVLQSTFLIIPEMQKRGSAILDAQRARGIETDAGVRTRLAALLPAVAPLILSSLTGVEERAMSLEARGMTIDGPKTSLITVPDSGVDKALRIIAIVGLLGYIGWRVWSWLN